MRQCIRNGCAALFRAFRRIKPLYPAATAIYSEVLIWYNSGAEEGWLMTVKERILALKLLEKQEKMPKYFQENGIHAYVMRRPQKEDKDV